MTRTYLKQLISQHPGINLEHIKQLMNETVKRQVLREKLSKMYYAGILYRKYKHKTPVYFINNGQPPEKRTTCLSMKDFAGKGKYIPFSHSGYTRQELEDMKEEQLESMNYEL